MFSTKCKEHLNDANMTRTGHMIHALTMAIRLQCLVPILIIHSIIPSLFKDTPTGFYPSIMTATNTMSDLVGDKVVNELDEHWDSTRQHIDQPNKWYNTK